MKRFKWILTGLAAVVLGLSIIISLQPADFKITRSTKISAPEETVFKQVDDFHRWQLWSPWVDKDPDAHHSFEGSAEGTGAIFSWSGNSSVGEGRMTILESRPFEWILIRLDFIKPFQSTATAEFQFKSEQEQTVVTWTMHGKNQFLGKAISLFMDCDQMVGGDFEKGLSQLKVISEKERSGELTPDGTHSTDQPAD